MSAATYSIEESLERSIVGILQGITALSGVSIVAADESDETELPMISLRAENQGEVSPGMQTYQMRLSASLTATANKTTDEEKNERRIPDDEDDDTGSAGMKSEWRTLVDTLNTGLVSAINSVGMVHVWGIEFQPSAYDQNERTFTRTVNATVWANEVQAQAS